MHKFSEQLRQSADEDWQKIIHHRFVDELANGTLPDQVMAHYLEQDYAFVDSLIRLTCAAIADAPTMQVRHRLAGFLASISSEENTYFIRSFDALNVPAERYLNPVLTPVSQAFETALLDAARLGYSHSMVSLLVAEWSYRSWAIRVGQSHPTAFYHLEWIRLHNNPEFNAFVDWIIEQVDALGDLPEAAQADLIQHFQRLSRLEHQFFDSAYATTTI